MDRLRKRDPLLDALDEGVLIRRQDIMSPDNDLVKSRRLFDYFDGLGRFIIFVCDLDVFVDCGVSRSILECGRLGEISVG